MAERTIQLEWNDETVAVTYDTDAIGRAYAETAQGFAVGGSPLELFPVPSWATFSAQSGGTVAALEATILLWDITEDDGSPFPPTLENLSNLPLGFLTAIQQAIDADIFDQGDD